MGTRKWGWERVGRRPPQKKKFLAILGAFLLLFLHIWGPFCYVFLIFGGLFTMGGLFTSWWGPFLGLPPYENFYGRPWLQGGFESMLPGNFFVWLQFSEFWTCFVTILAKIMINCSHVPARWVWRHANSRKMLVNGAVWSVFWYDFSPRKF